MSTVPTTGYIMSNGQDISEIFQPFVSGSTMAAPTNYIVPGYGDLSTLFMPLGLTGYPNLTGFNVSNFNIYRQTLDLNKIFERYIPPPPTATVTGNDTTYTYTNPNTYVFTGISNNISYNSNPNIPSSSATPTGTLTLTNISSNFVLNYIIVGGGGGGGSGTVTQQGVTYPTFYYLYGGGGGGGGGVNQGVIYGSNMGTSCSISIYVGAGGYGGTFLVNDYYSSANSNLGQPGSLSSIIVSPNNGSSTTYTSSYPCANGGSANGLGNDQIPAYSWNLDFNSNQSPNTINNGNSSNISSGGNGGCTEVSLSIIGQSTWTSIPGYGSNGTGGVTYNVLDNTQGVTINIAGAGGGGVAVNPADYNNIYNGSYNGGNGGYYYSINGSNAAFYGGGGGGGSDTGAGGAGSSGTVIFYW